MRFAIAAVSALVAATASATAASGAPCTAIDVIEAPVSGHSPWDGDRMRDARERLKDIIPGSRL